MLESKDVMNRYILYWGSKGSCTVPEGLSFLGRIDSRDSQTLGVDSYKPYGVYLYSPESRVCIDTGFESPIVSRRHLRIKVSGGRMYVMDHGVDGYGSTNGSILNNTLLKPGVEVEVKPGDTIRLAVIGPMFTVALAEEGYSRINVNAGVPIEYPRVLASEIAREFLVKEYYDAGDTVLLLIEDAEGERVIGRYIVRVYKLGERERRARTLDSLRKNLLVIENHLLRGEAREARARIEGLAMEAYKSVLEEYSREALSLLEQLLYAAGDESIPSEVLLRLVRRLKSLIQED